MIFLSVLAAAVVVLWVSLEIRLSRRRKEFLRTIAALDKRLTEELNERERLRIQLNMRINHTAKMKGRHQ